MAVNPDASSGLNLDERGMPTSGPYDKMNPLIVYPIITIIFNGIGVLVAWGIHSADSVAHDYKIHVLKSNDLGFLYLGMFIFNLTGFVQQVFVAVGRKASYADNPDQYIYETVGRPELPYVRLATAGAVGAFNRAQRGIDNSRETYPQVVVNALLAGYVYPKAVFGIALVYLVARSIYSHGYIKQASGRMPGQLLTMLATAVVLPGLHLFAGIKALV
eukprot:TRINITY_DN63649_c0_g1_i1.p1 TRINITY_DN63649_c0_g1~~TRINITY_DN63649_c0_g1_i1.p1  ORF type:complete len:217 (+),score=45.77 TRINITY_DN63649_c0_g1_i1:76-726(+)